jgi:cellulose synthase/poly-beta-1,6-N-acetylglucosamine synthase-like glycosyltransferase
MLDKFILVLFLFLSVSLWLSTFGYVLFLRLLVSLKSKPATALESLPEIAVVIPTLNEEQGILEKLADLRASHYPQEHMTIFVVDGGSSDRTVELVQAEIAAGEQIELLCLNGLSGKVEQVNHVLSKSGPEIIVFTDADSRLDPGCIRELVGTLSNQPDTALVGAAVKPKTRLLEERIHWLFLNYVWWLEGEVFSSAGISGVCYALNRKMFLSIAEDAIAEDIHLGLDVSARGYRVRINPEAQAWELRVPQTRQQFLRFRRRRGASYVNELLHPPSHGNPPSGWKFTRLIRIWQFAGVPWLTAAAVISSAYLCFVPSWIFPLIFLTASVFSAILLFFLLLYHYEERPGAFRFMTRTASYMFLTLISLFSLHKIPSLLGPIGGRETNNDNSATS